MRNDGLPLCDKMFCKDCYDGIWRTLLCANEGVRPFIRLGREECHGPLNFDAIVFGIWIGEY